MKKMVIILLLLVSFVSADQVIYEDNQPPVADAGSDLEAYVNQWVVLDGSYSYDRDNNFLTYKWSEEENILGEHESLTLKFENPGVHRINLQVTDNEGLTSTDSVFVYVIAKRRCQNTNTIYFPTDTWCESKWPNVEGEKIFINTKDYSCNLIEVCSDDIDYIIEEAIDCCDGTLLEGGKAHACKFANENAKVQKECQALYLIQGFSDGVYMQDYFEAEMCCFGSEDICRDPSNYNTANPLPKTDTDLSSLECQGNGKGEWVSDLKLELNDISLSDIHARASIDILGTGTCVDYSFALTTMIRKLNYDRKSIYSVESKNHAWNLVRFPLDRKFTVVDTTGNNNPAIKLGSVLSGYEYCEEMLRCYNDLGRVRCPAERFIHGCEEYDSRNKLKESKLGKPIYYTLVFFDKMKQEALI
ncbi:PKD domain-containing protein [archaeon]|nr:PKD domain-containing protein [archaeon]